MFHMLSCFDLRPGEEIAEFRAGYERLVAEMQRLGLVHGSGPVGRRQRATPMDTDSERNHEYFVLMTFRDRAQADAAYAHIERHFGPADAAHEPVHKMVLNPVFICWQDTP